MSETTTTTAAPPAADPRIEADRQLLIDARSRGTLPLLGAFVKLSGPGWLQAAITLGGGSLAGSLLLGAYAGYSLMWVQPLAMIMGIIMLSAIGYVVLSTGERPFDAINQHVNPVLGWAWLVATMAANMVWCMPQFALADGALTQNLLPSIGVTDVSSTLSYVLTGVLAFIAFVVVWFYNSGGKGIKAFEIIVKLMVALIVVSFVGTVGYATLQGEIDWGAVFSGFVPSLGFFSEPAPALQNTIEQTGPAADFWTNHVVNGQRDRMITVAATAVGINMTFLLPYSMLARGWNKDFRGMAIFDLATGLLIPFILVTSCVVIAAGLQMHNQPAPGLLEPAQAAEVTEGETAAAAAPQEPIAAQEKLRDNFNALLDQRILWEMETQEPELYARLLAEQESAQLRHDVLSANNQAVDEEVASPLDDEVASRRDDIPEADRVVAATVVTRDLEHLADAVAPLTGQTLAHFVFGIGIVGVALSTIVILMLINGFVFTEALNLPGNPWLHRLGATVAMLVGAIGAHTLWKGDAQAYFVVPTSVFGMMLAPIAYLAFLCLMNSQKVLGPYMPTGFRRLWWNTIMLVALTFAVLAAGWAVLTRTGNFPGTAVETRWMVVGSVVFFFLVAVLIHYRRKHTASADAPVAAAGAGAADPTVSDLNDFYSSAPDSDEPESRPERPRF